MIVAYKTDLINYDHYDPSQQLTGFIGILFAPLTVRIQDQCEGAKCSPLYYVVVNAVDKALHYDVGEERERRGGVHFLKESAPWGLQFIVQLLKVEAEQKSKCAVLNYKGCVLTPGQKLSVLFPMFHTRFRQ